MSTSRRIRKQRTLFRLCQTVSKKVSFANFVAEAKLLELDLFDIDSPVALEDGLFGCSIEDLYTGVVP